ncbi:MAG TPA: hypothetical protein PK967_15070 [Candidatus Hydrogenedentes bacterium]|nr:hypothetical protein [Candidatus Hydrogenedentota bacterium]HRT64804.1 hypothetical protein [Candidatus Hydrogenedentota bacterium]
MSIAILDMTRTRRSVEDDGKTLRVHIPIQLKTRGGRKEVIVPGGRDGAGQENQALVIALARAHRWAELLETGKVASLGELAAHVGVDPAYISRFLRLTLLAPDIIERILDGREPSGLSLRILLNEMPAVWEEQRVRFGMPAAKR